MTDDMPQESERPMKLTPERIEEIEAAILGHLASSIRADLLSERREREKEIERLEALYKCSMQDTNMALDQRDYHKARAEGLERKVNDGA